jgi:Protein of unknown function (DUF1116)
MSWLSEPPQVITAGAALLADALAAQALPVVRVDWQPPVSGTESHLVRTVTDPRRHAANTTAAERMLAAGAALVDVRPASQAVGLPRDHFLHAGPPVTWERASGPLRGGLIAGMLLEGLADSPEQAERRLASGEVTWEPCHHRGAVGPMAGIVSSSMWMMELHDQVHDNTAWCSLNEGLGRVARYGAYSHDVIERLRWMSEVLGPLLAQAVRINGPIDVKAIVAAMVQMGDEGHNRNRAGTLMLLRDLMPAMIEAEPPTSDLVDSVRFISGNDHFFLNLVMPAAKLQTLAGAGVPGSTLVTTMARNGTDFGIQLSSTGDQWFTGPAQLADGLYLGSFGPDDANPDIGDSAITETAGLGGFSMATAPAIVRFVGGTVADALATTRRMYEITVAENPAYAIPILEFRGAATGIDVVSVLRTGILPQINTGMAGKVAGTGQVGAGLVTPPMDCFVAAISTLASLAETPTFRQF